MPLSVCRASSTIGLRTRASARSERAAIMISILKVRSSHIDGIELPLATAALVPDTLQWWIGSATAWRIRTSAIDHDIHIHEVVGDPGEITALAKENNRKHFTDIIGAEHSL